MPTHATHPDDIEEELDEDMSEDEVLSLGALDADSVRANAEEESIVKARKNGRKVGFNLPPDGRYNGAMKVYKAANITVRIERMYPRQEHCATVSAFVVPDYDSLLKHIKDHYWTGEHEQFKWVLRSSPGSRIRAMHKEAFAESPEQKQAWALRMQAGSTTPAASLPIGIPPAFPPKQAQPTTPNTEQQEEHEERTNMTAKGYWLHTANGPAWVPGEPPAGMPPMPPMSMAPAPAAQQAPMGPSPLQMTPPPGAIWDGTKFVIPPPSQAPDPRVDQQEETLRQMRQQVEEMKRERERERERVAAEQAAREERTRIERETRERLEREYQERMDREREKLVAEQRARDEQARVERIALEAQQEAARVREQSEREKASLRADLERAAQEQIDRLREQQVQQLQQQQAIPVVPQPPASAPPGWTWTPTGWVQIQQQPAAPPQPIFATPVQQVNAAGEAFNAAEGALAQAMRLVNIAQQGGFMPGKAGAAVEAADDDDVAAPPQTGIQTVKYGGFEFPVDADNRKINWPMVLAQFVPGILGTARDLGDKYFQSQAAQAHALAEQNRKQALMLERAMGEIQQQDRILAQAGLTSRKGNGMAAHVSQPMHPAQPPQARRMPVDEAPSMRMAMPSPQVEPIVNSSPVGDDSAPGVPSTSEPDASTTGLQGALGYVANRRRAQ